MRTEAHLSARRGTPILLLLAALFMFSSMDGIAKQLSQTYPVPQIVWARYTFHMILLVPVIARFGPRRLLTTNRLGLQIVRSLLLFATTTFFFLALSVMPLANAAAIMFTAPLIVTALSVPLLGEAVGARRWVSVAVGFCGMMIIIRPGFGLTGWSTALPLAAAAGYALYQIATRVLSRTDSSLTTLLYTALVGTVVMNLAIPFFWVTPTLVDLGLLAAVGVLGGLSHYLFIIAYSRAPAALLAPFIYVQLIWATSVGYLMFGDFPDQWTILGAVIITASGIYIWHRENRPLASGVDAG